MRLNIKSMFAIVYTKYIGNNFFPFRIDQFSDMRRPFDRVTVAESVSIPLKIFLFILSFDTVGAVFRHYENTHIQIHKKISTKN